MKRAFVLGAMFAVAFSMSGCKGKVKKADLETKLMGELEKEVGVKPTSVSCPEDVPKKKDATTTCNALMPDGNTRVVNVTMSGNADGGFKWESPAVEAPPPPPQAEPETLLIPNSQVVITAPPGWKRDKDGDWGLLTSPDKKAVLAFVTFSRPNESTARIGQISRVLRASTINWGSPKRGVVGPDQLPAQVAGGSCLFNGKESSIEYATINPGGATQILVVYATNNDVPAATKAQAMETFRSIRRKR